MVPVADITNNVFFILREFPEILAKLVMVEDLDHKEYPLDPMVFQEMRYDDDVHVSRVTKSINQTS